MAVETTAWKTLLVARKGGHLHVTLNRPDSRNALSEEMVEELSALAAAVARDVEVRSLVLRGAGGTFCAGGDIKGFRTHLQATAETVARNNRRFGDVLIALDALPQVVVAVVEGMAMGGGVGLACIADVVLAAEDARFALSETSLGIVPAQIAPFVVRRIGLSQARRLALTGARPDGAAALAVGLAHVTAAPGAALDAALNRILNDLGRCAPGANAATKAVLRLTAERPLPEVLDFAAQEFARCLRGEEGREGVAAFLEKRPAAWVERAE